MKKYLHKKYHSFTQYNTNELLPAISKFTIAWDFLLNFWDPFCLPMLSHPYLPFVTDCKNKKLCFQPGFQPTNQLRRKIAHGDDKSTNRGMVSVKQTGPDLGLLTFVTAFVNKNRKCIVLWLLCIWMSLYNACVYWGWELGFNDNVVEKGKTVCFSVKYQGYIGKALDAFRL